MRIIIAQSLENYPKFGTESWGYGKKKHKIYKDNVLVKYTRSIKKKNR